MTIIDPEAFTKPQPDGRPLAIELSEPVGCCGARLLLKVDGTYRCPCGKRQERIAKEVLHKRVFQQ